jgi:hypothetical protein
MEKIMKTMTCKQLGGVCDKKFQGNSFDEIAELSKIHGMEMFQKQDPEHLEVMGKMSELMQQPQALKSWFEAKQQAFNELTED